MDERNRERPGDRNECDGLLRRLEPVILSVVRPFAYDSFMSDELAQLCRIRIYEKREQLREPKAVFKWAKTLCWRICSTAVATERERDSDVDDEVAMAEMLPSDPWAAVETGELRVRVTVAMERLPAMERQLLELRYWDRLSVAEIAGRVDLCAATVRTKLRRARLQLRCAPELVCYAPRRPSLWSTRPETAMVESRS